MSYNVLFFFKPSKSFYIRSLGTMSFGMNLGDKDVYNVEFLKLSLLLCLFLLVLLYFLPNTVPKIKIYIFAKRTKILTLEELFKFVR